MKIQSQLSQLDKNEKISSQNSSPNYQLKSAIQVKNEDLRQIRGLKQSVQFNIPDFDIEDNPNLQIQNLFQDRRYSHQPQIQKQKDEEKLRIQSSKTSMGFQNQNKLPIQKSENIDDLNERIRQLELENQKHKEMLERLQSKIILQTPTNFQKELSPIRQQQDELFSSIFSTNNLENEDDIYNRLLQSKSNSKQNSTKNLVSMLQSHTQPISNYQAQEVKYNFEQNKRHHNLEVQKVESQDTPSFTRANTQQDHHLKNGDKKYAKMEIDQEIAKLDIITVQKYSCQKLLIVIEGKALKKNGLRDNSHNFNKSKIKKVLILNQIINASKERTNN
eukprot:403352038